MSGYEGYKKLRDRGVNEYEMEDVDQSYITEFSLLGGFEFLTESDAEDIRRNKDSYEFEYQHDKELEQERDYERQQKQQEEKERLIEQRKLQREREAREEEELRKIRIENAKYYQDKSVANLKRDFHALSDEYASEYDRARALKNLQMQSTDYLREEIKCTEKEEAVESNTERFFGKSLVFIVIAIIVFIFLINI